MVDRITPVTAKADIDLAARALGVEDNWPVPCEPFFQWVIEDHFPTGRPPFEKALVQMVDDVMPYELMKLRLLNASHQGLCYFGRLSEYTYVHEVMGDPLIVNLLRRYMDEEATPTLLPVPGIDLAHYKDQLIERFSNPEVLDTVARLAVGTNGQVLKANSATATGLEWAADSAGMTNPMTTTGDTIYSSSGSTPARLGIGTTGQVLTVAAGVPSWAAPTLPGLKLITTQSFSATTTINVNDVFSTTYDNYKIIMNFEC
jgi:hypothetical protein